MNEFEYLYEDEFFIISSDNLNNVHSKLYGFVVTDEGILFNNPPIDKLDGNGAYIYIFKDDDNISIYQDFGGSYGLFVYHKEDYFAISNSFIKIVDFLKEKIALNLNSDYAFTYLSAPSSSTIYNETLIKEIQILPPNYIINIDIANSNLKYLQIDYHEKTIPIDSKECLNILDKWYSKWITIFNNLYENTKNLQFSLSGGFDSRVLLSLLLSSNVDLNKIDILSFISKKPTFIEDFEIASEIANDFDFELNNQFNNIKKYYFKEIETPINLSFYLRGGFAKQMYWKNHIFTEKQYQIRGFGGQLLKDYYGEPSIDSYILNQSDRAQRYSNKSSKSTKRILKKTFEEYFKIDDTLDDHEILNLHRFYTRNRHYSCTQITEDYLINNIILNPLMDPLLSQICFITGDKNYTFLLPCLIILRYCPKLLDYKFEGNRVISDETLVLANKINNISPLIPTKIKSNKINFDLENKFDYNSLSEKEVINVRDPYKFFKDIFDSKKFKEFFSLFFSAQIYEKIYKNEQKLFPDAPFSDLSAVMFTMKIIEDVMISQLNHNKTIYELLNAINNFPINTSTEPDDQFNITDARVDFKNFGGKDNEVIILNISDDTARIHKPKWFSNSKGIGLSIESSKHELDIKLKCIHNGKLQVKLKSKDVWDENNNRINIAYEKAIINSKNVLDNIKLASHDNPIILENNVNNGDIIDIHIEWKNVHFD